MQAFSIGPFVLGGDRLAFVLAMWMFLGITAFLSWRLDRRFATWASAAIVAGLVAARLGHVAAHAGSFAEEPLRAFAIWQGGFAPAWGAGGVAAVSLRFLRVPRFLPGAGVALGLSLVVWNLVVQLDTASDGRPLPEVTLEHLDGTAVELAGYAGRPVVINLWATWCPPCRREMPMMAEVAASNDDAVFLFVNQGEGRGPVERFLGETGLSLGHLLLDPHSQASRHYGARGMPVTLFLDAEGRMRSAHMGEISRELLLDGVAGIAGG